MKQQSTSLVRARCIERRTDTNALSQGNIHVLLSSPLHLLSFQAVSEEL